MPLHYLTVQDVVFLNLQVTKTQEEFDYAKLEEATFYQFARGTSTDIVGQCARFLTGFVRLSPFVKGNVACAFAGSMAFLQANGKTLRVTDEDAAVWVRAVLSEPETAQAAIAARLEDAPVHAAFGVPDFHEICISIVDEFAGSLAMLSATEETASLAS